MIDLSSFNAKICLADSVNLLDATARGRVVVSSSHGGVYAAYKAAASGARAVILNDAGRGLDDAGIACLAYCEALGMASAVVSHMTARIGEAADMMARGVISDVNAVARAAGCGERMACADAAEALLAAPQPSAVPPPYAETRFVVSALADRPPVVCIDSASLVLPEDAGAIVVTGSHGGLIGGRAEKAFNVEALLAVFNDAGVGIDNAGIGRLAPLDARGIAAATVGHLSARIGDARSTYRDGVLSHVNRAAERLGGAVGMRVADWVGRVAEEGGR